MDYFTPWQFRMDRERIKKENAGKRRKGKRQKEGRGREKKGMYNGSITATGELSRLQKRKLTVI